MKLQLILSRVRLRTGAMIDLFIRDDDVDFEEANLERLVSIGLKLRVPISLGIIPAALTRNVGILLNSVKRGHPELIELHQHGWAHINHEGELGMGEFGPARSYRQQREDLEKGRDTLERSFGDGFFPAFSPPWNVYTTDTIRAMRELAFQVLSAGWNDFGESGSGIQNYPSSLDVMNWGALGQLQPSRGLFLRIVALLMKARGPVGLLMHHRRMTLGDFEILESLLHRLTQTDRVVFHTFESLEKKRLRALRELDLTPTAARCGVNDGA